MHLDQFIKFSQVNVAYDAERKKTFHKESKKILRQIAKLLGLDKGEFSIRSNEGGIAVSGEVTLHADWVYIQFAQGSSPDRFMWRSCTSQKDYTGGQNQWMKWEDLRDLVAVADRFNRVKPPAE